MLYHKILVDMNMQENIPAVKQLTNSHNEPIDVNSCMMHKRRVNQFSMINFQASVEACHVHNLAQARPCNAMYFTSYKFTSGILHRL